MPGLRNYRHLVVISTLLFLGCSDDPTEPEPDPYPTENTPAAVLQTLKISYQRREPNRYAAILSDDFRFFFDPETRADKPELPEWWNRFTDSTQTAKIFQSTDVVDIRVELTYNPNDVAVNEAGRDNWRLITVGDEKLEIDLKAEPGQTEGITLLVDGQIQMFYFRKGRSAADTLGSPTSDRWYMVEWRDLGTGAP